MSGSTRSDESDPVAILFPGQGSQAPGMGRLVHQHSEAARLAYEEARDITGIDVARVCFEGDPDELAETTVTQPAVLTTSIAIIGGMREKLAEVRRLAEGFGRDPAAIDLGYWANWYRPGATRETDSGERCLFTGSDEDVIGDIDGLAEHGVRHVLVSFVARTLEETLERMERFAAEIIPLTKA